MGTTLKSSDMAVLIEGEGETLRVGANKAEEIVDHECEGISTSCPVAVSHVVSRGGGN